MSRPEFSTISLDCITDSHRWDIHPFLEVEIPVALEQSFSVAGILHPPLLLELDDGEFELVDGRKRLRAAREILSLTDCPCLVVPSGNPFPVILSLLLASQGCNAPLSPMETAHFLQICDKFLTPEDIAQQFLPRLPGGNSKALLTRYHRLLAMEPVLQKHVHHGFISESLALEMLPLQAEDRTRLADLFADFQMGGGKQRRFFSLIRDITMRAGTGIADLLDQPPLQEILHHQQMNAPQKVQNLLAILQQMATPSLHRDQQSFKARVATLALPPSCTVVHSQAFETDEVFLTIRFENFNQLRMASATLQQTLQQDGLSDT